MFLSMWISNTATTAMMVPIVDAVLIELEEDMIGDSSEEGDMTIGQNIHATMDMQPHHKL
jgi:sodium-dependent dicarboxylate transporter 2/3/5